MDAELQSEVFTALIITLKRKESQSAIKLRSIYLPAKLLTSSARPDWFATHFLVQSSVALHPQRLYGLLGMENRGLSLAGAAKSIIFVATKPSSQQTCVCGDKNDTCGSSYQ